MEFPSYILLFLRSANLHSLPLTPFRGSRFNIVFAYASFFFFLQDEFIYFINGKKATTNYTVLYDQKTAELIARCKALGVD